MGYLVATNRRGEVEHSIGSIRGRMAEIDEGGFQGKGDLAEYAKLNNQLFSENGKLAEIKRQWRSDTPWSQWSQKDWEEAHTDVAMALGSMGAAGAAGRVRMTGPGVTAEKTIESLAKGESGLFYVNPKNLISQQTKNEMSGSVVKRLEKDMKANGFDVNQPIIVVIRQDGRLVISDGHHRTAAAIRAGKETIPVEVYKP